MQAEIEFVIFNNQKREKKMMNDELDALHKRNAIR